MGFTGGNWGGGWFFVCAGLCVCVPGGLAFPCIHGGLLALPLCGAAPTFFAAAKKVGKESRFTPPTLKRVPWLGGDSGASGICVVAHSALVTRPSYFPPRTACSPERSGKTSVVRVWGVGFGSAWRRKVSRACVQTAHRTTAVMEAPSANSRGRQRLRRLSRKEQAATLKARFAPVATGEQRDIARARGNQRFEKRRAQEVSGKISPVREATTGFNELPRRRAQRRRKNDGLVTKAECATTQIPDGPLP
ncbi:hypothetical protein Bxe_A4262 [Paraburkholderia xenovorans LB400]|uniref:Uncharacterized protein n=1 Tax=Paraburkholderia xenovorans (strain LB400) TaxID=266265 RepID=Q146K1_PARXL|nr:hypothetical protein Bxe_A4262 [Paraburkholderia xenovorans LB400]